jgi:hypothetical protein
MIGNRSVIDKWRLQEFCKKKLKIKTAKLVDVFEAWKSQISAAESAERWNSFKFYTYVTAMSDCFDKCH